MFVVFGAINTFKQSFLHLPTCSWKRQGNVKQTRPLHTLYVSSTESAVFYFEKTKVFLSIQLMLDSPVLLVQIKTTQWGPAADFRV